MVTKTICNMHPETRIICKHTPALAIYNPTAWPLAPSTSCNAIVYLAAVSSNHSPLAQHTIHETIEYKIGLMRKLFPKGFPFNPGRGC